MIIYSQMKVGAVLNIGAILVLCAGMETIGDAIFDFHAPDLPFWAVGVRHRAVLLRSS